MMRMSSPSAIFAAKPQTPSQLLECGAPISTAFGRSGKAPTIRQPPSVRIVRPIQRVKRFGVTRGAAGGRISTGPSIGAVGGCTHSSFVVIPNPVHCARA